MKKIIFGICVFAVMAGCTNTDTVHTQTPTQLTKNAMHVGVSDAEHTSSIVRPSHYERCMKELSGAENAKDVCTKRMASYEPKQINYFYSYGGIR